MTVEQAISFLMTMPRHALLLVGPWNYGPDCYEAEEFDFRHGPVTVYPVRTDSPWYQPPERTYLGHRNQPPDDKANYGSRTLASDAQLDAPRAAVLFGYDKHVNNAEIIA